MREMGTVELLNRAGEIVIAKKIEEGQKLIYHAIQRFPESAAFFVDTFRNIDNEEEIDSLIADYVLDIKSENSEEFKSDQIPENSPNVLKMAEEKDNKDVTVNEINDEVSEDSTEEEDEDEDVSGDSSSRRKSAASSSPEDIGHNEYDSVHSGHDRGGGRKSATEVMQDLHKFAAATTKKRLQTAYMKPMVDSAAHGSHSAQEYDPFPTENELCPVSTLTVKHDARLEASAAVPPPSFMLQTCAVIATRVDEWEVSTNLPTALFLRLK